MQKKSEEVGKVIFIEGTSCQNTTYFQQGNLVFPCLFSAGFMLFI